jgi:hypothetical protein
MKDRWDKAQIILQSILGALGAILIPIIIVIVGGIISRSITQAQIESSRQIAQTQLTKDYISMLAQAVSKGDDKALQVILDSLAALKNMEGGIPPTIRATLIRIGRESKNKGIRGSVSLLTSSEDEGGIKLYFNNGD